ncbi:DUF3631 domain-containing protein [Verrucomicrobia bacterium]|nr:DUF3631 domain-containing protein [Verrucomicrobiota bacterium]
MGESKDLVIVEGEFKALSLIESRIAAIGLPSFFTYNNDGGEKKLLEGIMDAVNKLHTGRILFLGDSDTATNSEFSRSALFLAEKMNKIGIQLILPRLPIDGHGKGIDDCREKLKDMFPKFWNDLVSTSLGIDLKSSRWALQYRLLEREKEAIKKLDGAEKDKHFRRIQEMAKQCEDPIQKTRIIKLAASILEISLADFRNAITPSSNSADPEEATLFPDYTPWGDPVDTASLLDEVVEQVNTYCFLGDHAAHAVGLWCLLSYVYDSFHVSPILYITSPTKGCGKTTLLEIVQHLTKRPLSTSNLSSAALFRSVEKYHPTLIIDEADTFLKARDDMTGIINSGHRKTNAFVVRCDGDDNEPKQFSTWCPKAIAGIGRIKDTTEDRSICIELKRKPRSSRLKPLRPQKLSSDLRRKCIRWSNDHQQNLDTELEFTKLTNHRANDNWSPLIAIASLGGEEWLHRAEKAALSLSSENLDDKMSVNELLIADTRCAFEESGNDRMSSAEIVDFLKNLDGRPWAEFGKTEKPISVHQLARILKIFKITPTTLRFSNQPSAKGYYKDSFEDAWALYLQLQDSSDRYTVTTPENTGQNALSNPLHTPELLRFENSTSVNTGAACNGVTVQEPLPELLPQMGAYVTEGLETVNETI